jgi:tetratricopeptide (TPR) repeat protein
MAHLVAGRVDAMAVLYDRLLALFPFYAERHKLAPGYAALGDQQLAQDKLVMARSAYQRALRLDPAAQDARHWHAQLAYTDAELALSKGVLDLKQYGAVLTLEPGHAAAAEARDRLSGAQAARERMHKRVAAGAGLTLLGFSLLLTLRGRKRNAVASAS